MWVCSVPHVLRDRSGWMHEWVEQACPHTVSLVGYDWSRVESARCVSCRDRPLMSPLSIQPHHRRSLESFRAADGSNPSLVNRTITDLWANARSRRCGGVFAVVISLAAGGVAPCGWRDVLRAKRQSHRSETDLHKHVTCTCTCLTVFLVASRFLNLTLNSSTCNVQSCGRKCCTCRSRLHGAHTTGSRC